MFNGYQVPTDNNALPGDWSYVTGIFTFVIIIGNKRTSHCDNIHCSVYTQGDPFNEIKK